MHKTANGEIVFETDVERAVLYVQAALDDMVATGLLDCDGDPDKLTPSGKAAFESLRASGWRPTMEMVLPVVRMETDTDRDDAAAMSRLVMAWIAGELPT